MGHLRWKTRSQELKLKKKFVHTLNNLETRKVVLMISRSSSNMGHLGLKTRSHWSNMEIFANTLDVTFLLNCYETLSRSLFR
jgi:hypothetical protein